MIHTPKLNVMDLIMVISGTKPHATFVSGAACNYRSNITHYLDSKTVCLDGAKKWFNDFTFTSHYNRRSPDL